MDISADFTNPLTKQVARIWQVPFAIEILLPLETSDLNPAGICAPDCRLILVSLSSRLSLSYSFLSFSSGRASSPFVHVSSVHPRAFRSCYFTTCPFASRRPVTRQCRISRGSFLAANVTLLRSTKQTTVRR